jgi:hypothetical protein
MSFGHRSHDAFALQAAGIEVTLADRFICGWEDFDSEAAEEFIKCWGAEAGPLIAAASAAGKYPFRMLCEPGEDLHSAESGSFGAVFSHAVLEHVYDLPAVARELYRVTCPGGPHRRQIDLRDHNDFSRPLEFLLGDDEKFRSSLKEDLWRTGNRLRPSEIIKTFYDAGFDLCGLHPTETVDPGHLSRFVPRLRAAVGTRYSGWPVGDLIVTGARFIWRRPT